MPGSTRSFRIISLVVSILIGTNNLAKANGRANTNVEIVEGVQAIVKRVRQKCPKAKVLLIGILPRDNSPLTANRARILDINHLLRQMNGKDAVTFLNIGPGFVKEDGTLLPDITTDALHPNEKGAIGALHHRHPRFCIGAGQTKESAAATRLVQFQLLFVKHHLLASNRLANVRSLRGSAREIRVMLSSCFRLAQGVPRSPGTRRPG